VFSRHPTCGTLHKPIQCFFVFCGGRCDGDNNTKETTFFSFLYHTTIVKKNTSFSMAASEEYLEWAQRIHKAAQSMGFEPEPGLAPNPVHPASVAYVNDMVDWSCGDMCRKKSRQIEMSVRREILLERLTLDDKEWEVVCADADSSTLLFTLQCRVHAVSVPMSMSYLGLVTASLMHANSTLRSFRHGLGARRKRLFADTHSLGLFLDAIVEHGPCEDPPVLAPVCDPRALCLEEDAAAPAPNPILHALAFGAGQGVRNLPPYAPTTLQAFEDLNNFKFPADLKWFLTHVSREVKPGFFVCLCRHAKGVSRRCKAVLECQGRIGYELDRVAREMVCLDLHGNSDSGRALRRLNPDLLLVEEYAERYRPLHDVLEWFTISVHDHEELFALCNAVHRYVMGSGIALGIRATEPATAAQLAACAKAMKTKDAHGYDDMDPWTHGPLAPCSCAISGAPVM
jgi:hypothetical protein